MSINDINLEAVGYFPGDYFRIPKVQDILLPNPARVKAAVECMIELEQLEILTAQEENLRNKLRKKNFWQLSLRLWRVWLLEKLVKHEIRLKKLLAED